MFIEKPRSEDDDPILEQQLRGWEFLLYSEKGQQINEMLEELKEPSGGIVFEICPAACLPIGNNTGEVRRQASRGGRARAHNKRRQNEEIISKIAKELKNAKQKRMSHSANAYWLQRRKVVTYPNDRPISHSRLRQFYVPEALKRI